MSDLENYYLEKEKKERIAEQAKLNAIYTSCKTILPEVTSYLLGEFKKNPPSEYTWITCSGQKKLAWSFDIWHNRDGDHEYCYLTEDGNIYLNESNVHPKYFLLETISPNSQASYRYRQCCAALVRDAGYNGATKRKLIEWQRALGYEPVKKTMKDHFNDQCYIATAIYGSYEAPEVCILRRFKNEVLQQSILGRLFIATYYKLSPPVAERLIGAKLSNHIVKSLLDRWVERLRNTRGF